MHNLTGVRNIAIGVTPSAPALSNQHRRNDNVAVGAAALFASTASNSPRSAAAPSRPTPPAPATPRSATKPSPQHHGNNNIAIATAPSAPSPPPRHNVAIGSSSSFNSALEANTSAPATSPSAPAATPAPPPSAEHHRQQQQCRRRVALRANTNRQMEHRDGRYRPPAQHHRRQQHRLRQRRPELHTGTGNTGVGDTAGQAGTANTTGTYNTYIGYQAQTNGAAYTNSTALGNGAIVRASNRVQIGNSAVADVFFGVVTGHRRRPPSPPRPASAPPPSSTALHASFYNSPSDLRLKKDIKDTDLGLAFIEKLRPVSYRWKSGNQLLNYGLSRRKSKKPSPSLIPP